MAEAALPQDTNSDSRSRLSILRSRFNRTLWVEASRGQWFESIPLLLFGAVAQWQRTADKK